MNNSQLDGLIALKMVAEKRNFAAAAQALGISPSAISQIIKQLEGRLGIALLTRTTRSTRLSEAGERFLAQAAPAIDQILGALDEVGTYAKKPSGTLRINLPRTVYRSYLEPIVTSFIAKYPDISVELFIEDGQTDLIEEGFDAGIRLSDILMKDMVALKLFGPVKFVTAASPKYLNKMGRPKHPKDLLSHNCIRVRLGKGLYDRWEFESKGKDFKVQVKGNLILNDSSFCLAAAVDGAGITYTMESAVENEVKAGKLEIVLGQYAATSGGFYLYYPKKSQVQPKLRVFIDFLRECGYWGKGRST